MPIIKSAVKRVRQTKSRTLRNNVVRRRLRDAEKELESALNSGSKKDLIPMLSKLQSQLDTAVKRNLIHKNKAARTKQRYAGLVKDAGAKPSAVKKPKQTKPKTAIKTKK